MFYDASGFKMDYVCVIGSSTFFQISFGVKSHLFLSHHFRAAMIAFSRTIWFWPLAAKVVLGWVVSIQATVMLYRTIVVLSG